MNEKLTKREKMGLRDLSRTEFRGHKYSKHWMPQTMRALCAKGYAVDAGEHWALTPAGRALVESGAAARDE
jgi:hypothetical protein